MKLYCGDCLEQLKNISDNSVDCIVTSPPYNKGGRSDDTKEYGEKWVRKIYYDKYNDDLPEDEYEKWQIKESPNVYKKDCLMQGEVWKIHPSTSKLHPASFPEDLVKNCLYLTTQKGDIVLDPFMGSGTTGIVATKLQRDFIGIELSENYFEISKNRIEEIANNYCVANELW